MSAGKFFDTNILIYAYDLDNPSKRSVSLQLILEAWENSQAAISVQVLQELQVNLQKKKLSRSRATEIVREFANWPVVDNTKELFLAGLDEQERWQLSLWDALILAAARASGATELITEDFNNGQDYGGVLAINPFIET